MRTNKGVKGPGGQYFFEGEVLDAQEDGLVRLGWATNDAGLQLGFDNEGYGYGSDQKGYDPSGRAFAIHNAQPGLYGYPLKVGDVVGCYVDLDKGKLVLVTALEFLLKGHHSAHCLSSLALVAILFFILSERHPAMGGEW